MLHWNMHVNVRSWEEAIQMQCTWPYAKDHLFWSRIIFMHKLFKHSHYCCKFRDISWFISNELNFAMAQFKYLLPKLWKYQMIIQVLFVWVQFNSYFCYTCLEIRGAPIKQNFQRLVIPSSSFPQRTIQMTLFKQ